MLSIPALVAGAGAVIALAMFVAARVALLSIALGAFPASGTLTLAGDTLAMQAGQRAHGFVALGAGVAALTATRFRVSVPRATA